MRTPRGHVHIGSFVDHNLAALVRSRLEGAGIEVLAPNEHTSALRIPFVSGKLNLFVREEDEVVAMGLLNDPIPEDDGAWELEEPGEMGDSDEAYVCIHCGSDTIRLLPAPLWPTFLSIVIPGYSMDRIPSRWHCQHCDRLWED